MSYEKLNGPLRKRHVFCGRSVQCVFQTIATFFFIIAFFYFAFFTGSMDLQCVYKTNHYPKFFGFLFGPPAYVILFATTSCFFASMHQKPSKFWMLLTFLQCSLIIILFYDLDWKLRDCLGNKTYHTLFLVIPLFLLNSLFCVFSLYKTSQIQDDDADLYDIELSKNPYHSSPYQ